MTLIRQGLLWVAAATLLNGGAASAATCRLPDPYGCKLQNVWVSDGWAQEDWGGGALREACETMDLCYREAGAVRETCDTRFRADLFHTCDLLEEWWHAPDCLLAASIYARAAEVAGGLAFDRAQQCLKSDTLPPAPHALHVKIEPEQFYPAEKVATFKVMVTNDAGETVAGASTLIDGYPWEAGKQYTFTPKLIVEREHDHTIVRAPEIVVAAPGYASTTVSLSMVLPRLKVAVVPRDVACGNNDITVQIVDRVSGRDVPGTVTVGNHVGPTGQPIKIEVSEDATHPGSCAAPDVWVSAEGYPDTPVMKHHVVRKP